MSDCGSESASHYAGCDCHEQHHEMQLFMLTAERDGARKAAQTYYDQTRVLQSQLDAVAGLLTGQPGADPTPQGVEWSPALESAQAVLRERDAARAAQQPLRARITNLISDYNALLEQHTAAESALAAEREELERYQLRLAGVLTVLDGAPVSIAPPPGSPPDELVPYVSHCPTYAAAHRVMKALAVTQESLARCQSAYLAARRALEERDATITRMQRVALAVLSEATPNAERFVNEVVQKIEADAAALAEAAENERRLQVNIDEGKSLRNRITNLISDYNALLERHNAAESALAAEREKRVGMSRRLDSLNRQINAICKQAEELTDLVATLHDGAGREGKNG